MADPAVLRELAAIRRRAETRQTVPAADVLRLLGALESVLSYAAEIETGGWPFLRLALSHSREHGPLDCDCPEGVPAMWPFDPAKIREAAERELARDEKTRAACAAQARPAAAAGTEGQA